MQLINVKSLALCADSFTMEWNWIVFFFSFFRLQIKLRKMAFCFGYIPMYELNICSAWHTVSNIVVYGQRKVVSFFRLKQTYIQFYLSKKWFICFAICQCNITKANCIFFSYLNGTQRLKGKYIQKLLDAGKYKN